MSYIEFKNVVKEYKMGEVTIKALDNTNFSIDKGELVVIVGPSGAGKTTTLNILGGMDKATSGQIFVNDKEISKLNNNVYLFPMDDFLTSESLAISPELKSIRVNTLNELILTLERKEKEEFSNLRKNLIKVLEDIKHKNELCEKLVDLSAQMLDTILNEASGKKDVGYNQFKQKSSMTNNNLLNTRG